MWARITRYLSTYVETDPLLAEVIPAPSLVKVTPTKGEPTRASNEQRLQNIGYENDYPRCFEDLCSSVIMDDPVYLVINKRLMKEHIMDYSSYWQCYPHENTAEFHNPFTNIHYNRWSPKHKKLKNEASISAQINVALRTHINRFVTALEQMEELITQLDELQKPVEDFSGIFEAHQLRLLTAFIAEQKTARLDAIITQKRKLEEQLNNFIHATTSVIKSAYEVECQASDEIKNVLQGAALLQELIMATFIYLGTRNCPEEKYDAAIRRMYSYHALLLKPQTASNAVEVRALIKYLAPDMTVSMDVHPSDKDNNPVLMRNVLPPCQMTGMTFFTLPRTGMVLPFLSPVQSSRPGKQ